MSGGTFAAVLGVVVLLCFGAFSALKPRLSAYKAAARSVHQPVPQVTQDDVERIVHRDFPVAEFENVIAILKQYGGDKQDGGASRVRLAALKLAAGNLDSLQKQILAAKQDYRDVLVWAEYPEYSKVVGFRTGKVPKKERQRIVATDWKQYPGERICTPRHGCIASKSAWPVTITSALPFSATSKNLSSLGSRHSRT
jgi:hypothetical protein